MLCRRLLHAGFLIALDQGQLQSRRLLYASWDCNREFGAMTLDEDDLDDELMKLLLRVMDLAKETEAELVDHLAKEMEVTPKSSEPELDDLRKQKDGLLVNAFIRAAAVIAHTTHIDEEAAIDCFRHHQAHWRDQIAMWDGDFSMKQ